MPLRVWEMACCIVLLAGGQYMLFLSGFIIGSRPDLEVVASALLLLGCLFAMLGFILASAPATEETVSEGQVPSF